MSSVDLESLFGGRTAAPTERERRSSVRRVCIVGGGTAGWMTALILRRGIADPTVEITLVESPTVGIIGVGEGSTPALRGFFEDLGIPESEWMPQCNATYKCGITFRNWSTKQGFESYFHPFASILDNVTGDVFVANCRARVQGADVPAHPDRFFLATRLAREGRAPKPAENFPFEVLYGYHFDAGMLGQYLGRKAVERGIRHLVRHVREVRLTENGDIAALALDGDEAIEADLFVDCSGFAGLLIDKALKTPFVPFGENLFNDAAVAMPTPLDGPIAPETVATALQHGWAWRIPLTSRYGNGYVYSSAYCSADQAEFELRERLGLLDADVPARHLKMKVGRVSEHWRRNCLAVGLSQGFIEPLEATALLFIQRTASVFVDFFNAQNFGADAHTRFNAIMNERFEGTRDYIVSHYKTNSRRDTAYWRDNAFNVRLSDRLRLLLGLWMNAQPLPPEVKGTYPLMSWYALLAGMGLFPDPGQLRAPEPGEAMVDLAGVDDFIARSAVNFCSHGEALANFPQPMMRNTLRVYRFS